MVVPLYEGMTAISHFANAALPATLYESIAHAHDGSMATAPVEMVDP